MTETWPFGDLKRGHYKAILADPPWRFNVWSGTKVVQARGSKSTYKPASVHYHTVPTDELASLPVAEICADDAVLFMWICWPTLLDALALIESWGFTYKTCGFDWMKAHVNQIDLFRDDADASMGMGYWTRANSEPCLLATRGKPKRLNADVRQGIIAPRREHSRKPEGVHQRIERLVAGPYVELFARQTRKNWSSWGNELNKFGFDKNLHELRRYPSGNFTALPRTQGVQVRPELGVPPLCKCEDQEVEKEELKTPICAAQTNLS